MDLDGMGAIESSVPSPRQYSAHGVPDIQRVINPHCSNCYQKISKNEVKGYIG